MDRLTLAMLEVTDGKLPSAVLPFTKGLNVISGAENRGKSYAFACLDYLFGASDPPDSNPHSVGYTTASLYYTVNDTQRGVVNRNLENGESQYLPLHPVAGDVPTAGWIDLTKTHRAKSTSLSSYWVAAFGFQPDTLRGNMSGKLNALTIRTLAHLVLIDELRIMAKQSPARQTQATSWPADTDAFALVLGARKTPPRGPAAVVPVALTVSAEVRSYIEQEIVRLDTQIQSLVATADKDVDEGNEISRRAAEFTSAADAASKELSRVLADMEEAQQNLTEARARTKTSREIATRLVLLQEYYVSDLRRLEAIAETTYLLKQLNSVPCPTCEQPLTAEAATDDGLSAEYLEQIQVGAKAEAGKIRSLRHDLEETLSRTIEDTEESAGVERTWANRLSGLREAEKLQAKAVAKVHAQLEQTFAAMGQLAQRQALKQRRAELTVQLAEAQGDTEVPAKPATQPEDRTEFEDKAVEDFCAIVKKLLIAWKWKYTEGPLEITFDQTNTDIVISGAARRSFGKAARALACSAFLIAVMDHCLEKGLPHPGFVVLDSPLTTKKEKNSVDDEQVSDEIVAAFFTHLTEKYADKQVIIFDNKEPPASLRGKFNHVRFEDDAAATRKGFFPASG